MAYSWQSDIIRPDGENGTEVLDANGVYQPQIEGGDNITIENGRINASGTLENVQASWSQTNPSDPSYIKNKPTIPAAQVPSDWNAVSGVAQILNKPDLSAYATDSELSDGLATKQNVISDLDTIRAGAEAGATAAQPSDLPSSDELLPSATSGDAGKILSVDSNGDPEWITPSGGTTYSAGDGVSIDANNVISADVDGTTIGIDSTTKKIKSLQVIPTKTSDLQNDSNFVVASSLATVATSGSYTDLSNKPVIPTKTSDLQNDSNFVSSSSLATVATTGSYNDLSDKPVIPPGVTVDQTYSASSANAQSGTAVAGAIAGVKQVPTSTSADKNKVLTVNSSGNPVWENSAVPASKPLVAGSNITITENTNDVTISATGSTYTAGDGIGITSGVVSADVDGTTIGIDSTTKKIKSLQTIPSVDQTYSASSTNAQSGVAVAEAIAAIPAPSVDEVPAVTSSDDGKVLKATYSGGQGSYAWGTDSDTTYTAGNMIAINANNSNAIGVSTTAGITDIQQVAQLPANPVATVLYLIPEA